MVKIHYCLAIILSECRLPQSSWGEQSRCLDPDVQRHSRWFRLPQIPRPGWQMWCWSNRRYTPFWRGSQSLGRLLDGLEKISANFRHLQPIHATPCLRGADLCSSAEWISKFAPYIIKGQKWIITWWHRNQHFSAYTDIPTFARTNISMFALSSLCLQVTTFCILYMSASVCVYQIFWSFCQINLLACGLNSSEEKEKLCSLTCFDFRILSTLGLVKTLALATLCVLGKLEKFLIRGS